MRHPQRLAHNRLASHRPTCSGSQSSGAFQRSGPPHGALQEQRDGRAAVQLAAAAALEEQPRHTLEAHLADGPLLKPRLLGEADVARKEVRLGHELLLGPA